MLASLSVVLRRPVTTVLLIALIVNVSILSILGPGRPVESDTVFYVDIARNVVEGRGYVNLRSPWPEAPTTDRLPGWTGMIAGALLLNGGKLSTPLLVRGLSGLLNVLAASLIAALALRVTRDPAVAVLAGLGYVFYLPALYLTDNALSEIPFVCLLCGGALLLLRHQWLPASLLLGAGCLFRGNMLFLGPALAIALFVWFRLRLATVAACVLAFAAAPGAWMIRNALVAPGCAGVLTSASGEVVRGALNPVVMYGWENWGYWVFPNEIPGEPKLREVAATRNQCETAKFYQARAVEFAKENWTGMPLLMAGRIARAYLPFTTHPTVASVLGFGVRGVLLVLVLATWKRWRQAIAGDYQTLLAALFGVSLFTTLALVAGARHSFWLETMVIPCAATGLLSWWRARSAADGQAAKSAEVVTDSRAFR
ncbi:MAG: hypothetical protein U0Q16_16365 [Bryobacteraceae bacterium]